LEFGEGWIGGRLERGGRVDIFVIGCGFEVAFLFCLALEGQDMRFLSGGGDTVILALSWLLSAILN